MFTSLGLGNWKYYHDWICVGWEMQVWSCIKVFLCIQLTELYVNMFYMICTSTNIFLFICLLIGDLFPKLSRV